MKKLEHYKIAVGGVTFHEPDLQFFLIWVLRYQILQFSLKEFIKNKFDLLPEPLNIIKKMRVTVVSITKWYYIRARTIFSPPLCHVQGMFRTAWI